MNEPTRAAVERWWRELFNITEELWSSVTVSHPHTMLGDYDGWYVAWRDAGVHVSAPSNADAHDVASLRDEAAISLQDKRFWLGFARQRGLTLIGPGVHRYLDEDPGAPDEVDVVDPSSLLALRDRASDDDWHESGFADAITRSGAVAFATEGGAAVLSELDGAPRDIGVLVAPDRRGRGLGTELGRAAASYAVRRHGYARWRCRDPNVPSTRAAARLGFEPYVTQLAIRLDARDASGS